MQYPVIVQAQSANRYVAEPLGKSELRVEAGSEAEALRQLARNLGNRLGSAKLVHLEVPAPGQLSGNPWLDTFGSAADDPAFEEFLAELARARAMDEPA